MISDERFKKKLFIRKLKERVNSKVFLISTIFAIVALVVLITQIFYRGWQWLDWQFISSYPSRFPEKAGIKSAFAGSIWLILLTAPISFIIGVGTAIYLEEYAKNSWFSRLVKLNISNLAGVPSIIYGLLGLAIFVRGIDLGRSLLAGSLTMALLILPIIVVAAQEAIIAVPESIKHAALALGATRWQTIKTVTLPTALPGILTGTILAVSRAIGETAPLIMIGALSFVAFLPTGPMDGFTALPIQIFNWTSRPQEEFQNVAAAGIIILLLLLLTMNSVAIIVRNKFQKRF